jgi:hypothetical protein
VASFGDALPLPTRVRLGTGIVRSIAATGIGEIGGRRSGAAVQADVSDGSFTFDRDFRDCGFAVYPDA